MDVVLRFVRQLVVHHVREVFDVQTSRSHVGGHENLDETAAECLQGACPLLLAAVAVDRGCADAAPVQVRSEPARAELAAGEDQNLLHRVTLDQVDQQVRLAALVYRVEDLGQVVGDAVPGRHFDDLGIVLELLRHPTDVV